MANQVIQKNQRLNRQKKLVLNLIQKQIQQSLNQLIPLRDMRTQMKWEIQVKRRMGVIPGLIIMRIGLRKYVLGIDSANLLTVVVGYGIILLMMRDMTLPLKNIQARLLSCILEKATPCQLHLLLQVMFSKEWPRQE